MKQEEFEKGLVEYLRKELNNYNYTRVYFNCLGYLIVDCNFLKEPIYFNIEKCVNKNLPFENMKYPSCLDAIVYNSIFMKDLYSKIYLIIKEEFDEKMDKVYTDYYKEENIDNGSYMQELQIGLLKLELDKYKSLYQNAQSQLQAIKLIVNKIENEN